MWLKQLIIMPCSLNTDVNHSVHILVLLFYVELTWLERNSRYFIHHFPGTKVMEFKRKKKKNTFILKYHFITIQTEFIIAVRHFIMSATYCIDQNVLISQYNFTRHIKVCCFVVAIHFKVQLMLVKPPYTLIYISMQGSIWIRGQKYMLTFSLVSAILYILAHYL